MKKIVKVVGALFFFQLLSNPAIAQETDLNALFATAQAEGKSIDQFVAQMTELKTCNPKLAEQVIEFALAQVADDPVLIEKVLRSINTACVDEDTVTALAIASNIDPALVSKALQTATAAGAGQLQTGPSIAATPGGVGAGGGTGTGDGSLASRN